MHHYIHSIKRMREITVNDGNDNDILTLPLTQYCHLVFKICQKTLLLKINKM